MKTPFDREKGAAVGAKLNKEKFRSRKDVNQKQGLARKEPDKEARSIQKST